MIHVRVFDKINDFGLLCRWFLERNFPNPSRDLLPETGVIASDNDMPLACGFLFKTDSGVASISHLVTNPSAKKDLRQKALNHLISVLSNVAKENGFKIVTIATNIDKLGKRIEDLGFIKTDKNVEHFRRDLCLLQQP